VLVKLLFATKTTQKLPTIPKLFTLLSHTPYSQLQTAKVYRLKQAFIHISSHILH